MTTWGRELDRTQEWTLATQAFGAPHPHVIRERVLGCFAASKVVLMHRVVTRAAPLALATYACLSPGDVYAQSLVSLIDSPIPLSYSRGRNVSVTERDHPEDKLNPIPVGSFDLLPRLSSSISYTDNVYQSRQLKISDGYVSVAPRITLASDWDRHSVTLNGSAALRRYFSQSIRDQDGWSLGAAGRLDLGDSVVLNADASRARTFQSSFSGSAVADLRSAIPLDRTLANARAVYTGGRFRLTAAGAFTDLAFKPVTNLAGVVLSQDQRDREVVTGAGQVEYALSPDTALFVLGEYSQTDYKRSLGPIPLNRGSQEVRALAGVSLDISSLIRGSVAAGYTRRNYKSPAFRDLSGLSVEGRIDYFPTRLTTVAFTARRVIEDSTIGNSGGFYNTGFSMGVDHELLRNLLLRVDAEYSFERYLGISGRAHVFQTSGGARYLFSRRMSVDFDLRHGDRSTNMSGLGPDFGETRATLGASFKL